jgi:hypothetical protein
MIKLGIEVEEKTEDGEKTSSTKCSHPLSEISQDDDVFFCGKCGKYLTRKV